MDETRPVGEVEMKRSLSLTGITVNAMALIAPGAFLWTTFQVQAAQTHGASSTAPEGTAQTAHRSWARIRSGWMAPIRAASRV